jgi:uncharacterized membrane protein (UPF0127 family)
MTFKEKEIAIGGLLVLLLLFIGIPYVLNKKVAPEAPVQVSDQVIPTISVDSTTLYLLIADNEPAREKGLGGLAALHPDQGMLFVFDESDFYPFWMKDMQFPIDMIWLDEDYHIVHIEKNISPDSYPTEYVSREKAKYVLEVNAGFAEIHSLKYGDILKPTSF